MAELFEMVELETMRVPPTLKIPPPLREVVLPEIVELKTVRAPELLKAPPCPEVNIAPEAVTPEMDKFPPEAMLKILKSRAELPLSPLMVREEEPGPLMVRVPAVEAETIVGSAVAEVRVMVLSDPVPFVILKLMVSLPAVLLALSMASLRERKFATGTSELVVTVKVAGVILSSRPMSSSRLKQVLGLALRVFFLRLKSLLKNELITITHHKKIKTMLSKALSAKSQMHLSQITAKAKIFISIKQISKDSSFVDKNTYSLHRH